MANDFKNAQNVGVTTQATVYTAPALKTSIILELDIANTSASAVTASAKVYDSTASTFGHIVKDAPVPVGASLQVVSGQKIILEAGDYICVVASGTCDVICSILEDVNS
jgi:hypothetical protein|tara:strand:- start:305 stop:631 length:327 start_codon:yes stop_codon:yes gene_type:complete